MELSFLECSCGTTTPFSVATVGDQIQCAKCARGVRLPSTEGRSLRVHIIESDLSYRARWLIGMLGVAHYALFASIILVLGLDKSNEWVNLAPLVWIPVFAIIYWATDSLRTLYAISWYRPLGLSWVLGYVIAFGTLLFAPGWFLGGSIIGSVFFLIGSVISLASSTMPVRSTSTLMGSLQSPTREPKVRQASQVQVELRKTVLMLRSFADDSRNIERYEVVGPPNTSSFNEYDVTLERTLSYLVDRKGLKLSKVSQTASPEGALSLQTTDDNWQHDVSTLVRKCLVIFMLPGNTPGVIWEIEQLVKSNTLLGKTVLVFPKETMQDAEKRWSCFREIAAHNLFPVPLLPTKRNWDPAFVRFDPDGGTEWIVVRHSKGTVGVTRRAYWYCLDAILEKSIHQS